MSTVSKTILIGNLGQDPQTTTFEGGGKITRFSIATTEKWTDKSSGEKKRINRMAFYCDPKQNGGTL